MKTSKKGLTCLEFGVFFIILFALLGFSPKPGDAQSTKASDKGHGGGWLNAVPQMIAPLVPPVGRPAPQKPLNERTDILDAIILGTKIHQKVYEARDNLFVGVIGITAEKVLKGDHLSPEQVIEVVLFKWHDKSKVEEMLAAHMAPRLKRGILCLKALPEGAPFDYRWASFHMPGGDDWESVLQTFSSASEIPLRSD